MNLILVDKSNTRFNDPIWQAQSVNLTEEVLIHPDRSQSHRPSTDTLLSEIMEERGIQPSTLNINLTKAMLSGARSFLNLLINSASNFDILKELRARFQENVKISVSIKSASVSITAEDMAIQITKGDNCFCEFGSFMSTNEMYTLTSSSLHVRITACISEDMWTNQVSLLREKYRRILDDNLCSDIIITAGNGVEVKAHKSVLMGSSPVFQRMFATEMKESETGKVELTFMSEDGVRAFLRYIYYNDKIKPDEDISLAYELLNAGHKYEVSGLEASMISYLLKRKNGEFGAKVALEIYTFVKNLESPAAVDLKAKLIDVFHLKSDELMILPEYNDLFKNPAESKELCANLLESLKRKSKIGDHESSASKLMRHE